MFKRIPVRVTVSGTNPDNSQFNVDVDYFLFEIYAQTWNDFLVSKFNSNFFRLFLWTLIKRIQKLI
jgi:hypothetical protein